ncbi:MAG: hypothetical protein H0X34_18605 [Chthoniobacterales bacterium]|nr:hypothetical protein [Chthoniobacterales bacterium]
MRLELTPEQSKVLRPIVANWDVDRSMRPVFIGQLSIGDWQEPEKTWLIYTTITPATACKVRQLIEKERAKAGGGASVR